MQFRMFLVSLIFSNFLFLINSLIAQQATPDSAELWIQQQVSRQLNTRVSVPDLREKLRSRYLALDLDGDGISDSDHDLNIQLIIARQRSASIGRWLKNDLNGDGRVTRAELELQFGSKARQQINSSGILLKPTPQQSDEILRKLVDKSLIADKNDDETVTFQEALEEANRTVVQQFNKLRHRRRNIPDTMDLDDDGTISEMEFMTVSDRVIVKIDRDGDQRFSKKEIDEYMKLVRQRHTSRARSSRLRMPPRERCAFPKVPEMAKIVLLGAYEGKALSTAALGGDDEEVHVADIVIDAGKDPLYILISSYHSMIWRFSGATKRIAQVVISSAQKKSGGTPRVGVVGLPSQQVHIPPAASCLHDFYRMAGPKARKVANQVNHLLGKSPDTTTGAYSVGRVRLPSAVFEKSSRYKGAVNLPKQGPGAPLWRAMLRFSPGGLVQIDPKAVTSRLPVKPFAVLPQQAGLAQLLESGALQAVGSQQSVTVGNTTIVPGAGADKVIIPRGTRARISRSPSEFLIVKKMTYPAGLYGAHSVTFVLKPGVPEPDGTPGHSRVRR